MSQATRQIARALMMLLVTLAVPGGRGQAAEACSVSRTVGKDAARMYAGDTAGAFPEIDSKLAKGLAVTVVHEVSRDGAKPVTQGCKVFYDLWDETYEVTISLGGLGAAGAKHTVKDAGAMRRLCNTVVLGYEPKASDVIEVTTHLDPVSDEQLAKTRQWLAEKGISNSSGAFFGRAAYAIVDLKQQKAATRRCAVQASGGSGK